MNLILKMSYWRECSPDFVTQIVLNLVARVYLPDDYVLRQGEVGDEMYMVNRGLCEFAEDEKTEDDSIGLSTKGSGCESSDNSVPALHVRRAYSNETLPSSSGIEASDEAGAVHPVPSLKPVVGTSIASGESFGGMALLMNYPSKTGVRAVTYVEMCVLERTKFQQLLARYPDDRRRVLRSMLAACVDKRDIPFTRKEIDQMMARKRQKPMDDSDHVSMKELVEALLGSMKQPSADQTNGFRNRVQVDYAGEFIKITPRRLHRRRSGRSRSGSSGSLTNVLKLSNEVPRADTLISAAADSSMEHQKRLQAHVDAVDARIQALKRKQAQYTEALHRIAAQIEPK